MKIPYRLIEFIRHGKCTPEKCGGACCKESMPDCEHFVNGLCAIHETKLEVCKAFPFHPEHPTFKKVESVCGFWFEKKVIWKEAEIDEKYLTKK